MSAQWTADVIGKLHLHKITRKELAEHMSMHPKYVIAVLNGKREPKGAEKKFKAAVEEIIRERSHSQALE